MNWNELGALHVSSIKQQVVDLKRLNAEPKIAARTTAGRPAPVIPVVNTTTRFLIKVAPNNEPNRLLSDVRQLLGGGVPRPAGTIAAEALLRPLGRVQLDGSRWYIVDLPVSLGGFLATIDYDLSVVGKLAKALTALDAIVAVEADLPVANLVRPLQEFIPGCTAERSTAPTDVAWAPRFMKLFELPSSLDGTNIKIGQIDTGYTEHPELNLHDAYSIGDSISVIDGFGGVDQMPGGTSHGTATASVITSRRNSQATNDLGQPSAGVTGLAPGATIVAVRAIDFVVVLFPSVLVAALWHCIKEECHIITMSFGGFVGPAFGDVVREAYLHNIILCAAAGNCVGFVVEPASLPEVIGCGAIGIDAASRTPHLWPGTSEGAGVDISAPAEHVWIADWQAGQAIVRPGQGTSFAAPSVAGAAALWLEHHGRQALLDRYTPSGLHLGDVFKDLIRSSAQVPAGWDTANNGAGIVDLAQLMREPLPTAQEASTSPSQLLDLIPLQVAPVKAVIELDRLVVRDDGEAVFDAEPYLLVTFFKIDGTSAMIEATLDPAAILSGNSPLRVEMKPLPGRNSIVTIDRRGGHRNVAAVNIGPLELSADGPKTIRIDSAIGLFRTEVAPIPIRLHLGTGPLSIVLDLVGLPGFVGVHALMSEEDFTPDNAIIAARNVVADAIKGILEDVLSTIELSDLSISPGDFKERQLEIEDEAKTAAAAQMNPWELLWGGVLDPDDQLIQVFEIANILQLGEPKQISEPYQGEHGNWLLRGEIRT